MDPRDEEGWFTDPFGRHEARWLSQGNPTKLVRDGDVESYDDPPDEEPSQEPVRIEVDLSGTAGRDLLRADSAEEQAGMDLASLNRKMDDAAFEGAAHPEIAGSGS